jgi:hypothetical protein
MCEVGNLTSQLEDKETLQRDLTLGTITRDDTTLVRAQCSSSCTEIIFWVLVNPFVSVSEFIILFIFKSYLFSFQRNTICWADERCVCSRECMLRKQDEVPE